MAAAGYLSRSAARQSRTPTARSTLGFPLGTFSVVNEAFVCTPSEPFEAGGGRRLVGSC